MTRPNDPKRYYRIEAREILEGLSTELLALSRGETRADAANRLFRFAHTLKGAATVVGDTTVVEMARILEDVLGVHRDSGEPLSTREVTEFLRMVEGLEAAMSNDTPPDQGAAPAAVVEEPQAATTASLDTVRVALPELDEVTASLASTELQTFALLATFRELERTMHALGQRLEHASESGSSAEVPGRLRRNTRANEPLRELFARLDLARRNALGRVDAVARELAEARGRVTRLALVPAGSAFPTMERAARLAAAELGKSIRVEASGGDVRIDRHVLPVINNALLHVIRNAVDHGIENPAARAARSKELEGRIRLSVERRGSRVAFVCEDDGAGIDPAEVRTLAIDRGWLSASEANQLDDAAALRLLFRAGISTRTEVTNWSGRGVGLDVVNAVATSLRGHASLSSRVGLGTHVELVVPVSLSTATVLVLQVEESTLLMPLDVVRRVSRVPAGSLHRSETGESMVLEDELLPVLRLSRVLGDNSTRTVAAADPVVLIVAVGDERYAVVANAVLHIKEVTVRPLPWAAGSPLGIAGAALDVEGISHLVLDPRGLITILRQHSSGTPIPTVAASAKRYLPILVIDDSLTTRMLEQSILQTAGFNVDIATSAEEGLSMASAREYGLFVVDVEMPGMNGFEFTAMTRADPRFRETSVVLVTSLSSEADQERGRAAGAAAYVVKGQFDQDHFLNQVRTLSRAES